MNARSLSRTQLKPIDSLSAATRLRFFGHINKPEQDEAVSGGQHKVSRPQS